MMKWIYTLILCIFLMLNLEAQPYKNAVGVRAGYSSGLTFRHFHDFDFMLEGQALYNPRGFQFTALYGYQFTPYAKKRLHYYAAAGAHAGNWEQEFALGAALMVGSEYVFRKAPVIIGLEWKPMVNIYKVFGLAIPDVAMTLRVSLN